MKTIYVGNLHYRTTEEELRKLLEPYGVIERVSARSKTRLARRIDPARVEHRGGAGQPSQPGTTGGSGPYMSR